MISTQVIFLSKTKNWRLFLTARYFKENCSIPREPHVARILWAQRVTRILVRGRSMLPGAHHAALSLRSPTSPWNHPFSFLFSFSRTLVWPCIRELHGNYPWRPPASPIVSSPPPCPLPRHKIPRGDHALQFHGLRLPHHLPWPTPQPLHWPQWRVLLRWGGGLLAPASAAPIMGWCCTCGTSRARGDRGPRCYQCWERLPALLCHPADLHYRKRNCATTVLWICIRRFFCYNYSLDFHQRKFLFATTDIWICILEILFLFCYSCSLDFHLRKFCFATTVLWIWIFGILFCYNSLVDLHHTPSVPIYRRYSFLKKISK
jgi:hypothetical protein